MNDELTPKQELILWNLLITGDEPMMSKIKPELRPPERKPLVDKGLIRLEKRGQSTHIVLEDKAWDWISERMQADTFTLKLPPKATSAIPVFETLLIKLGRYLRSHNVPLTELLTTPAPIPLKAGDNEDTAPPLSDTSLESKIRQACIKISENNDSLRIRLSQLHQQLSEISPNLINDALLTLQQNGELSLRPVEDPQEITTEDEQAAIDLGDSDKRYFVYFKQ